MVTWCGNLYFWEKFNGDKDFEGFYYKGSIFYFYRGQIISTPVLTSLLFSVPTMPSFGPSKQRTVIAILTASALGTGCQAWLSRAGNINFSSASAVIARGSSYVSKASRVPLATAAAVATVATVTASTTGFFSTFRLR